MARIPFLRQQIAKREGRANMCLADFIDPEGDWIGGFAVTAGHGIEPHLARFKAAHDDYNDILLKALADRLAEAFAERLHQHVRTDLWGYAPGEQLTNEALIKEQYRGIRPAPGYPACPDHSLKPILFDLLDADTGRIADRKFCDAADRGVSAASISGIPKRAISAWRASGRISWPIMRRGAGSIWTPRRAGCVPIWIEFLYYRHPDLVWRYSVATGNCLFPGESRGPERQEATSTC